MIKKSNFGSFVISLDFELHWGCFESMLLTDQQQQYFLNTRTSIPSVLDLFQQNNIHATWATVGMLYRNNAMEWQNNQPAQLPTYENLNVSSYEWIKQNGFIAQQDPCHFAPVLIDLIKQTPFQEIGTHTYAHYYCLEPGQTKAQFKADLKMACAVAADKGTTIHSLVFPRNQFNQDYLSICAEMGISSVRSNPDIWYWQAGTKASLLKKIFRSGDAYLKFQSVQPVFLHDIKCIPGQPLLLPASRLYRPWKPKFKLQNKLKLRRILNEMTAAAQQNAYYHLWWHPHNFGYHPQECLAELEQIVLHYSFLHKTYGFESRSMQEITQQLLTTSNHFS